MYHGKEFLNFLLFEVFCITNLFCTRVKSWYDLHNILEWSFHHSQSRVLYILKGTKIICHYPFGQKNSFGFLYLLVYKKDSKLSKMYKLQQYFFCTYYYPFLQTVISKYIFTIQKFNNMEYQNCCWVLCKQRANLVSKTAFYSM